MYHVREYDVQKLNQVQEPIDIFLSHDWPVRITDYGDWEELVRKKSYFKQEVRFIIFLFVNEIIRCETNRGKCRASLCMIICGVFIEMESWSV